MEQLQLLELARQLSIRKYLDSLEQVPNVELAQPAWGLMGSVVDALLQTDE